MAKCSCGKEFDEEATPYIACDVLKDNNKVKFCSKECMHSWAIGKIVGMAVSLVIGLILGIGLSSEAGYECIFLTFVPYMLRRIFSGLGRDIRSTGEEALVFMVTLFGSLTLVYPIYKIIQETREYVFVIRQSKAN